MLETLVQVAKELVEFEANKEGISKELMSTKYLCKDLSGEEIKVLAISLEGFIPKVSLEDYKSEECWKYLCAFSTGGQAIGPSAVIDLRKKKKKELEKEAQKGINHINRALKKLKSRMESESGKDLEDLSERLFKNSEELIKGILDKGSNNKVLLTLEFGVGKKPGEEEILRKAFIQERILGESRAKVSFSRELWRCGICGEQTIVRPSLLLDFFTVEKRGFTPLGMDTEAWKYVPLCEECTKWLCVAQNFLKSHLQTKVAGKRAYLIPNLEPRTSKMPDRFVQYLWEFRERTAGKVAPEVEEFPEAEESYELADLFEDLVENYNWSGPPPFRSASLVFHAPGQKFLFLYTTSDILPRQLKKVSESLKDLREALRNNALGDLGVRLVERRRLRGDFNFISEAWNWPVRERQKTSPLALNPMGIVETLLTQNPPHPVIFWKDVDKILRRLYLDALTKETTTGQEISWRVALIWTLWALLYREGGSEMEKGVTTTLESTRLPAEFWEDFFRPKRMLDTNAKRGMFLLGVLFGRIEYQQRKERNDWRGEMPILSSLRGLSISADELKQRLFPQLITKLRQLSAYSEAIAEVEAATSYNLSCSEGIPDEEARFVFCLGWALSEHTLGSIWDALTTKEKESK